MVTIVILWGAFVRVTHSGAGCGRNWPLCKGEVLVINPQIDTLIELFHRLTSGFSLILVLTCYLVSRKYPKSSLFRISAFWSLIFILSEALIGAGLVLFGWVKDNSSSTRAVVVALHLINSFLLLLSLAIHSYSSIFLKDLETNYTTIFKIFKPRLLLIFLFLLVACSGAITALGDTLFPSTSLVEGLNDDFSPDSHFLIRLRTIHPILALLLSLGLFNYFSQKKSNDKLTSKLLKIGLITIICQVLLGLLNVLLLAPSYLQISHLFLSIVLWTIFIWTVLPAFKKRNILT
jgi:heme A synthase